MDFTFRGFEGKSGTCLRTQTHRKRPKYVKAFHHRSSQVSALQILVIVSSFFLLASICMLILSTIPEFQV